MSATELRQHLLHVDARSHDVFVKICEEVQRSVVEGSEITSAPGQPVDTGFLKNSWIGEFTAPDVFQLTTNVAYAPVIEEGIRDAYDPQGVTRPRVSEGGTPSKGKSTVGGSHSVALTVGGFTNIVAVANAAVPDA